MIILWGSFCYSICHFDVGIILKWCSAVSSSNSMILYGSSCFKIWFVMLRPLTKWHCKYHFPWNNSLESSWRDLSPNFLHDKYENSESHLFPKPFLIINFENHETVSSMTAAKYQELQSLNSLEELCMYKYHRSYCYWN